MICKICSKNNSRGFTLAELLVAMGILAFVLSSLLLFFINCLLMNEANSELITAAHDAEHVLELTKAMAYAAIANSPYAYENWMKLRNEQRRIDITEVSGYKAITVTVRWDGKINRRREFQLFTQIARTN